MLPGTVTLQGETDDLHVEKLALNAKANEI